ncbi:envelope stress response membrane protein PspB [Azospirillum sp. ST 5-10]|uniref:envelope stress response membrane protein PspB n=1 Tax=unclassified Azospirillum TaxID=2630922 RepID=UPI003F49E2E3
MSGFGFVLAVLFLVVVAPLWIVFHYLTRWRSNRGLSAQDERLLAELWDTANRMEGRIHALERVLDAEAPGWRAKI